MGAGILQIHVGREDATIGGYCRGGNWMGTVVLCQFLALALERAGVAEANKVGSLGELNDSIYMANVTNLERAVEIAKEELSALKILDFAQIGIVSEEEIRCVHPSPDVRMGWLMDAERQELFLAQSTAQIEAAKKELFAISGILKKVMEGNATKVEVSEASRLLSKLFSVNQ